MSPAARPAGRAWSSLLLWLAPLAFLGLFYFFPLGGILQVSLARSTGGWQAPFIEAFSSPAIRRVVWFTAWQAG
ncbi:MAG: iron ABC transporter permease, partial [Chloroflexota bacterium]